MMKEQKDLELIPQGWIQYRLHYLQLHKFQLYNNFDQTKIKMFSGKTPFDCIQQFSNEKESILLKKRSSQSSVNEKSKREQISKEEFKTHLIRKFKKNLNLKNRKQKKFHKLFKSSEEPIFDECNFTCPVCLQILISPIVFQCGHFGCMKCIQTVSAYQNKCFLCRKVLDNVEYNQSQIIKTIIYKNILNTLENPLQHYSRLADHLNWQQKKKISIKNIQIGSVVDVRCAEGGKWKSGCVLQIQCQKNKCNLLIKYRYEHQDIQQLINIDSARLAKGGFYTEKKVIQQCNNEVEVQQHQIPQISIETFSNSHPDRYFFVDQNKVDSDFSYYPESDSSFRHSNKEFAQNDRLSEQNFNIYETELNELLSPSFENSFFEPQLLELSP